MSAWEFYNMDDDYIFNQMFNNIKRNGGKRPIFTSTVEDIKEGTISIIVKLEKKKPLSINKFRRFGIKEEYIYSIRKFNDDSGKDWIGYIGEGEEIISQNVINLIGTKRITLDKLLYLCIVESQYIEFEEV